MMDEAIERKRDSLARAGLFHAIVGIVIFAAATIRGMEQYQIWPVTGMFFIFCYIDLTERDLLKYLAKDTELGEVEEK